MRLVKVAVSIVDSRSDIAANTIATMSDLTTRFQKAAFLIRNGPPRDASNEKKLEFYSFFKQATEGDVTGSQPWAVQLEARAKWDAWYVQFVLFYIYTLCA